MSQNMNSLPLRTLAVGAALTVTLAGCTEREGPPPVPTIETSTEQETEAQDICDITTRERVADFLRVAPTALDEGGCVADSDSGITAHQTWQVSKGPLKGLALASFTTDETASEPGSFSFANLYETVPKSQQCETPVDTKVNDCVTTDDSAGVLVDNEGVFTQIGFQKTFAPLSAKTTLNESFGDQLTSFSASSAELLVQSPKTTPESKKPTQTDLSERFQSGDTNAAPVAPATDYNYAPCSFYDDGPHACASLDPAIETGFVHYSDTTGCTFEGEVDYGDGNRVTYQVAGRAPGHDKLPEHRYSTPGTYAVKVSAKASGGCNAHGANFNFTLQEQPTPATCANKLDQDRGRAYLYSMLPKGTLKRAKNASSAELFVYDEDTPDNNRYVDAAGVTWHLLPEGKSKYHQPTGWDPVRDEGRAVYRKFVTEQDSAGGSYEAVLMPDGATATTTFAQLSGKTPTYTRNNWLLYGKGMPTYNLDAPTIGDTLVSTDNFAHAISDVLPHEIGSGNDLGDGRYVAPDTRHIINPATADWRTYRERMIAMQELIDAGYHLNSQNNHLEKAGTSHPVGSDLLWAAKVMIDCAD